MIPAVNCYHENKQDCLSNSSDWAKTRQSSQQEHWSTKCTKKFGHGETTGWSLSSAFLKQLLPDSFFQCNKNTKARHHECEPTIYQCKTKLRFIEVGDEHVIVVDGKNYFEGNFVLIFQTLVFFHGARMTTSSLFQIFVPITFSQLARNSESTGDPVRITQFDGQKIISCTAGAAQSYIVTSEHKCYAWGYNR